ncbi:MAG: phosphate ABC transporter permease PstA [Planctomycetes bacterium]|nr:phosphate ABC transporter permease PstA [Planctomycetota bacterium]MCW8135905.1 phosphate ABC transporter permease PstA [Planctomycetota bacterium]
MKRHRISTYNEVVLERIALPHAAMIERLEKGVLNGYVTRVTVEGNVLADIEKDGREGVWQVFEREQQRMREHYLVRYDLEKNAIGRVNFELKDLEDAVKQVRYDNRKSHVVSAGLDRLAETYTAWQSSEPLPDPELTPEAFAEATAAWLETLPKALDEWQEALNELKPAEAELAALTKARALMQQRARVQAIDFSALRHRVVVMRHQEEFATYDFMTSDGRVATLPLAEVVRAFRPNETGFFGTLGVYLGRVWEYLSDDPRESNTEGGIWPVILGTLVMTLLMCVVVVPFGVIAALYLREYAKQGTLVSAVRISVNNLAGVPSIVFGIFGLGFFCVMVGGTIDDLLYPELAPAPLFGGGGVMWAALTLALLTVPVVVVSTEEALSAVPSSQREASLACGASKFQTIWRVILPQAMPGVLTGTILAMARGAGEVAPLMLVGAVKYAPYAPADTIPPFVHLERKFMHLGFHVYDVGFQSPNVDNTKPLVFATALILIGLVAVLNIFAISLRNKLRRKLATSHV